MLCLCTGVKVIIISLLLSLCSRETKGYQGQGVSQDNRGAPEEMCVVYDNIIIIDEELVIDNNCVKK